jgi:hypothetical protein
MKVKDLKKQLKQVINEEYNGYKKDQDFKLKTDDDGFDNVAYLPKFNEIRRKLKGFGAEFKQYKVNTDPNIADLAKDITKTFNQLGQLIYILDTNLKTSKK